MFTIQTNGENKPVLEFSKMEIPTDIKDKLNAAFVKIFG
jgi:hypothetical protein